MDAARHRSGRSRRFSAPTPQPLAVAERDRRWHPATTCRPAASRPGKAFVDFQNDVTAKDIRLATREGFRSIEHVKRYTTTGMATDQGKTSNINAPGVIAADAGQADARKWA